MKKRILLSIVILQLSIFMLNAQNNVGINTTMPDPSAALDVQSTSQGVLVPRMTAAQRTAITPAATGLLVYQTDAPAGFYYNSGTPASPSWTFLGGEQSQLQKLDEGNGNGWRLLGAAPANYGNIGNKAVDLSNADVTSVTTFGATGALSTAMGTNTTASGTSSTAMGSNTTASGYISTVMGSNNTASGYISTAMGYNTIASGYNSTTIGYYTTAPSFGEVVVGTLNTTYAPSSSSNFNASDRAFTVGIGYNAANLKDGIIVWKDGSIGIGISTLPNKAKLQVEGSKAYSTSQNFAFYNSGGSSGGVGNFTGSSNNNYSIWASDRIGANEFNAFSDKRIKTITGLTNNDADLNTLAQLRITDYTMKDKVQYGNKQYKKVIAQEVREVYPQAVTLSTNTVPDIYQSATAKNGWVSLKTDLKKGDNVKIITPSSEVLLEVLEVNATGFKTTVADGVVFVYGKEVNDFHTVDYEALTTLNISATQALLKKVEALEKENATLKATAENNNNRLNAIENWVKQQYNSKQQATASISNN